MASGTSWASAEEITPTNGKAAATAVKTRAFRRLRVMFIVRSCGSGALPRVRQSGRTLAVTKLAEGKAKERTKFADFWGSDRFAARKGLGHGATAVSGDPCAMPRWPAATHLRPAGLLLGAGPCRIRVRLGLSSRARGCPLFRP